MLLAVIIVIVWVALAFFAWAFIHGAAKLRQMEDDMRASQLAPVLAIAQADASETEQADRAAA